MITKKKFIFRDGVQIGVEEYQISDADYISECEQAVQAKLDLEAQSRGYDNIVSACSYAAVVNPFQVESQAFIAWRGNVWAMCYQILADVQNGLRPAPTIAELLAEMPVFTLE